MDKTNRSSRFGLGSPAVFIILLAAGFAAYYYALVDFPRRDHIIYMAERAFVASGWDWFWHSVSLSRSRHMAPGDYYLFRPLHMAVLALRDILFRDNLYACGSVNVLMAAVAGFSLYRFARQLLMPATALLIALLFMVQYAGLEMVAWGHIAPYMLAMAFFGFALTELVREEEGSFKRAAIYLALGSLVHEAVVVMLVSTAFVVLLVRLMAGREARAREIPLSGYLLWVFALPLLIYGGLDVFDYVYHGTPSVLGPGDLVLPSSGTSPIGALLSVPGASVVAFVAPFLVKLEPVKDDIFKWDFGAMLAPVQVLGAVLGVSLLAALALCVRALYKGRARRTTLPVMMSVFMLGGTAMGIGIGRVIMRGIEYFYGATYYYSITAFIFCIFIAVGLHHLRAEGRVKRAAWAAAIVLMSLLIVVNFVLMRQALKAQWPVRQAYEHGLEHYKELLGPQMKKYCFMGSDDSMDLNTYSLLLRKYYCLPEGDARTPAYVTRGTDGALWLARLRKLPFGEMSRTQSPPLASAGPFILSASSFNRPDLALTADINYSTGMIFSYKGPFDYLMFMLKGPLVSAHETRGGRIKDLQLLAVPRVGTEYHAEVRHSGDAAYLFFGDYLMASIPASKESAGKVGLFPWATGGPPGSYSSFVETVSTDNGGFVFEPIVRLGR